MTGSGTAGAYHAGVLRSLQEAGVKIDLVAGRGIGVVSAMFSAVDGGTALWDNEGAWNSRFSRKFYDWRLTVKAAILALLVALSAFLAPLLAIVTAAIVYPVGFILRLAGLNAGDRLALSYTRLVEAVFQPDVLPLIIPRFISIALLIFIGVLVVGELLPRIWRKHPRSQGVVLWRLFGAPLSVSRIKNHFTDHLWAVMRGTAKISKPEVHDLSERYVELLSNNVGQPGFRELIVTVHDLDARRDLVFGLLASDDHDSFFGRRLGVEETGRDMETIDLSGPAQVHAVDVLSASVRAPVVTEAHLTKFGTGTAWSDETHRLCDRPDAIGRLLEEVALAGVEQVILVSGVPEPKGPHSLTAGRRDLRGRVGEFLLAVETSALRDALAAWKSSFQAVFHIHPSHNPLGAFDFSGIYDEKSDRLFAPPDLMAVGSDDGFKQFVDPVLGASGEGIGTQVLAKPELPADSPADSLIIPRPDV